MMIGLLVLAMWLGAVVSAACLVHIGKRQERPPLPVPAAGAGVFRPSEPVAHGPSVRGQPLDQRFF